MRFAGCVSESERKFQSTFIVYAENQCIADQSKPHACPDPVVIEVTQMFGEVVSLRNRADIKRTSAKRPSTRTRSRRLAHGGSRES